MQETHVRSLGWEDPLEGEMAISSSILAWKKIIINLNLEKVSASEEKYQVGKKLCSGFSYNDMEKPEQSFWPSQY